jgi:hypothetical protein
MTAFFITPVATRSSGTAEQTGSNFRYFAAPKIAVSTLQGWWLITPSSQIRGQRSRVWMLSRAC